MFRQEKSIAMVIGLFPMQLSGKSLSDNAIIVTKYVKWSFSQSYGTKIDVIRRKAASTGGGATVSKTMSKDKNTASGF